MRAKFLTRAETQRLKLTCRSQAELSAALLFRAAPLPASTKLSNCATATSRTISARACCRRSKM